MTDTSDEKGIPLPLVRDGVEHSMTTESQQTGVRDDVAFWKGYLLAMLLSLLGYTVAGLLLYSVLS